MYAAILEDELKTMSEEKIEEKQSGFPKGRS
jgi:hypothetical protein